MLRRLPPGGSAARAAVSLVTAVAALIISGIANAGQVRVDVNSNFFSPRAINANPNDHVVWVWISGGHSVTSGDSSGQTPPDGVFDSNVQSPAGTWKSFSWRVDVPTLEHYFCMPHMPGMAGRVIVAPSHTPVASFRITEIAYNRGTGDGLVEITNLGDAAGDLGRYRFTSSQDTATVPVNNFVVPVGARVVVHVHKAGTQSAPDSLFLPTLNDLPDNGSLSLFVPNTAGAAGIPDSTTQIIDFVQWGATAGQPNESKASSVSLWNAGQVLAPLGPGNSLEFCGSLSDHGSGSWAQIYPPTFGSNGNCLTTTYRSTWGRLKMLYR
jgi:plastocyanin